MSREELERLDDRGINAWDTNDPQAFADLFADDLILRDVAAPEPIRSKEGVVAYAQAWFTAFPDMSVKQTNRVVGDDSVAAEIEFRGTNTGPMVMGGNEMPATGKSVVGTGTYFARVRDGKIVEFGAHPDVAGVMMQLGLMPGK